MKLSDVKQIVLTELTPFAEQHGLEVKKDDFGLFSKKGQNPSVDLSFTYNTCGFEVKLFPWVDINFKEISEICEACGFNLNYAAYINLLVLEEIHKHGWNRNMTYKLFDSHITLIDGEEGIDKFRETMNRLCPLALEYIKRYSTIEAVDKLYNQPPFDEYNPNCSSLTHRCFIGLIAAKLVNNPEYDHLKKVYSAIIQPSPWMKNKIAFDRLIKYLDDMPAQKTA